ncbi:MAG TPA: NAD(P)H-hydrate dehydratase [Verrucomicrobiae bacterium]|nr:NAD(P)H-hydrate dehydratase [Verrucomicrobiae bacterium]
MLVVTSQEMRELDRLTIEKYRVPSLTLMENAGEAVAEALIARFSKQAKAGVLVVCGKGNNGGDGFVVARHLKKKSIPCEAVLLARKDDISADSAENLRAYLKLKGKVFEGADPVALLRERLKGKKLIVDAILGTGLKENVRGVYAEAIELINGCGHPVIAVDIPSGLDGDTGRQLGAAITAEMTVALAYPKLGEVVYPGVSSVGELAVADIGIRTEAVAEVRPRAELLEDEGIGWLVPERAADSHKGTYGHLLVFAGSRGKTGAAILSCRGALRSGAGLVTLAAAHSLNVIFASALVEAMTEPLAERANEEIEPLTDQDWRRLLERKSAVLFGPGVGVNDSTRGAVWWLLRNLDAPLVIDADGLNLLSGDVARLASAKRSPVLTPHPGEMARLLGTDTAAVNGDRAGVARSFSEKHRCYIVLKGARTIIATPEGRIFINPTGNPGMASGGMGDVLAGILAGLLAQGFAVEDALKLGVYVHGFAGDQAAMIKGQMGLIASDVIEALPQSLKQLKELARQRA